jgi:S-formylglutathione hydrolase FrmB
MDYAARRPHTFRAAASFSGVLHPLGAPGFWLGLFSNYTDDSRAVWGDPNDDRDSWRRHDPTALVASLVGVRLFVSAGTERPGPFEHGRGERDPVEGEVGAETRAFVRRARMLGVRVRADLYGAGTHTWPYWQRELHRALPVLLGAIR